MYKTDTKYMMILYFYIIKWYYILQLSLHGCPLVIIKWYVYNTDTEDVKDEILIDSAISEVCETLEVQRSQRCTGGQGSHKGKVKMKASVPKTEQGPTATEWKTVVNKLPAVSENILKRPQTQKKIASM